MDHMMMQFSFKGQRLFPDANNNAKKNNLKSDKTYQLRPRGRTREVRSSSPIRRDDSCQARPRSAPLSKYRRKTANARERSRMREINQAFEALRRCVPQWAATPCTTPQQEKLTKITTLRLAMKYIGSLTAALREADSSYSWECDYPSNTTASSSSCCYSPGDPVSQSLAELELDGFPDPDTLLAPDNLTHYFL